MASAPTEPGASPVPAETIARRLTEHVQQAGPTLGARLGLLARALFPSFSPAHYACRNLQTFIEKYAPDIHVAAKSGPDPVYAVVGAAEAPTQTAPAPESDADLWRVWVSPAVALAILVDTETGSVEAVRKESPVPDGRVALSPASLNVHKEIARTFIDGVEDHRLRADLTTGLTADGPWWRLWLRALRRDPGQLARWYEHRQRSLSEALKRALEESGLKREVAEAAFNGIIASRRKRPVLARRRSERLLSGELPAGTLLQVVKFIAARMSENELRSLPLPLGLTLDAVEHFKVSR